MPQNIYDNDEFFAGYAELPRSRFGLDGAPEWASVERLLPDLNSLEVLDLGCGYGWFCRKALALGASRVLGLDLSEKMLEQARSMGQDPRISYQQADLDALKLESVYDFAYSSLTLHYLTDVEEFFRAVHGCLRPGSTFIFTLEHPMLTAPRQPGWQKNAAGENSWPVNHYLDEGRREVDWIVKGVVKQHRSMGSYVNALIRSGFRLLHLEEWGPTDEQLAAQPALAEERDRPTLAIFKVRRED